MPMSQQRNFAGVFSLLAPYLLAERAFRTVTTYIENQENHHSIKTFQDEYRKFLEEYEVEYDERYVWD
jgi:hypothetical protein